MKALLSQWIGGGNAPKKGQMVAPGSAAADAVQEKAGTENQAFLGFMMGFLGMGTNPEVPEEAVATVKIEGQSVEGESSKAPMLTEKQHGRSPLLDGGITTEVKIDAKSSAQKATANEEVLQASEKQSTDANGQAVDAAISAKKSTVSGEATTGTDDASQKVLNTESTKGGKATGSTAKTLKAGEQVQQGATGSDTVVATSTYKVQTTSAAKDQEGLTVSANAEVPSLTGGQESSAALLNSVSQSINNEMAGKTPGESSSKKAEGQTPPAFQKLATENKETATTVRTNGQSQQKDPSTENGSDSRLKGALGSKGTDSDMEALKKEVKTLNNELRNKGPQGEKPKAEAGKAQSRTSLESKTKAMARSGQGGQLSSQKTDTSTAKPMPGNMISGQSPATVEVEMDMDTPQEFKGGSDNIFKEVQLNELKSSHLGEAAARKSFSRQLAQASRQQLNQQAKTASQEGAQWKHHRFMMEDGKSIRVAARSTDGALQLQLNAGNGELGKILHQHLQDIQQHVQQELKIKIDLQLQNFSGGAADQQAENPSGEQQQATSQNSTGKGSATAEGGQSNGSRSVRYYGFNSNEWTA